MEFRKIVTITLYARQQKRHRCIEQSFALCGRVQGWDDLGEWHWNMYIIICEMDRQSRLDAWDRVLRAGALGWFRVHFFFFFQFIESSCHFLWPFSTVESIASYDHVLHLFKHFSYAPPQQLKWCFPYETMWDSSLF